MSRRILRGALPVLIAAVALAGGGCGATVYSPAHPIDPAAVFVADYGRHSSVFLPMGEAAYVEYSVGDWDYYALGQTSTSGGLRALFWSQSTALGRRYAASAVTQSEPAHLFQPRIFRLCVAAADMRRLRDKLENRWRSLAATKVFNALDDTDFVRDPIHYSWLYNCNNWTAQQLREMGCRVVGITTFSAFRSGDKPGG